MKLVIHDLSVDEWSRIADVYEGWKVIYCDKRDGSF